MRSIMILLMGAAMGGAMAIYGTLLTYKPDAFLRFHETFVDRSKQNKNAAWRKNVYNSEYKILGMGFLVVGILIVLITLIKLGTIVR